MPAGQGRKRPIPLASQSRSHKRSIREPGAWGSTVEVGSFPANNFGLFDMHGNVWEWCEDCWHESYADKPEGLMQTGGAWTAGDSTLRVLRGGSWLHIPQYLRSAVPQWELAEVRNSIGFRVARTLLTS